MEWLGPEDPRLKDRLTSLLDDVPCLSARSPRHSNGHGGDEYRPWVVPVVPRRREPNLLELPGWMDEPLPEDYKVRLSKTEKFNHNLLPNTWPLSREQV